MSGLPIDVIHETACLGLAKDDVAVAVGRLVHLRGCQNEKDLYFFQIKIFSRGSFTYAYVLGPPESDTGDTRDLLQAEGEESLPGLALRTRLDFLEGSGRSGVFLVFVVVLMVVIVAVMGRVIGVDFLDMCGHLREEQENDASDTSSGSDFAHPPKFDSRKARLGV